MKNYTFKKVDEKLTLDSPVWNDVEKATLDNDNFCGENAEKITVELIVHFGSPADGKQVKELLLPPNCLLISIRRGDQTIIPKGDTQIIAEDYLVFITDRYDEDNTAIYEKLIELTTK